jgi:hypothetical protein
VILTATVTSAPGGSGTPTGYTSFYADGQLLGTAPLDINGVASLQVDTLTAGSHAITATYQGDPNFGTSSAGLTQYVSKADTTTMLNSDQLTADAGTPVTFTASVGVQTPGGGTPNGVTVHFYDNGMEIGTGTVVNGQATFTTSDLSVGSHNITAHFDGDGNYNSSDSATLYQTIV